MATAKKSRRMPPANTKTLNAKRLESENRKLRQKNEKLEQKNSELELISHSFLAINSSLELDRVLATILEAIRNLFGVVGSSIWLKEQPSGEVVCRQAAGFQRNVVKGWRLAPGEGIAGWVSSYGESVILPDTREGHAPLRKSGRHDAGGVALDHQCSHAGQRGGHRCPAAGGQTGWAF